VTSDTALRFAILSNSFEFPKWQADCLRQVINSGLARPVLIVINNPKEHKAASNKSNLFKKFANRRFALWRIFNRVYVNRVCKATRTEDLSHFLSGIPVVQETPIRTGRYSECFSRETLEHMKAHSLDFALRFGFGILKGDVLKISRYGVWSYHHGDPSEFRGQPPGFWEMFYQSPVTGTVLQVLSEVLDAGKILHRGVFQTTLHSYAKTRDVIYAGSSCWVRRTCANILENGWQNTLAPAADRIGPNYKEPNNREMITFLMRVVRSFFKTQIRYRLFRQKWNCGVVKSRVDVVAGLQGKSAQKEALQDAHWMTIENDSFVGDPFGIRLGTDSIRLFFERMENGAAVGSIATCEYKSGQFGKVKVVLDAATHLSYPFVWQDIHGDYLIPEQSAAKNVSAFRLGDGGRVEQKITLFNGVELIDTTLIEWNKKIWAFALVDGITKNTELHIFYADKITGPWRGHALNPVKSDVSNARPAGAMFVWEGKLYRPAQDCSVYYGSATVINEVKVLTETDFQESAVSRVDPLINGLYNYGLHTLSQVGDWTLIDGAQKEFALAP
jgi:hypothetical protein